MFINSDSDTTSTTIVLKGRARNYDTGADSVDELDDSDYDRSETLNLYTLHRGENKAKKKSFHMPITGT